jgi:CRP-like cAMP-binding protein
MEELIGLLQSIHALSPPLEGWLRSVIKQEWFGAGEHLLEPGQVSRDIWFIRRGLVRSYRLIRGREVSKWFMKEGDICISILSFLRQAPADDSIIALEDCECWGITYDELQDAYREFPEFNLHGRLITSDYYIRSELRNDGILGQLPEDKYAQIMRDDPDLVSRVPYKHLASFLNVSERTFYDIRRDYAARKRR